VSLRIYTDLQQGTPEWIEARRGLITASTVGQLITARTLKPANNDTSRGLTAQLIAERVTGRVEETFQSHDMWRGTVLEPYARAIYSKAFNPVGQIGFMTEDKWGFTIGYSPDGLVGDAGLIEIKSPRAKAHISTVVANRVPDRYIAQVQTGLLVSGREWIDFISYCPGVPLFVKRVEPDQRWFDAIVQAAEIFEANAVGAIAEYEENVAGMPVTEYVELEADIHV
jgi:putative phage-type endonuclease